MSYHLGELTINNLHQHIEIDEETSCWEWTRATHRNGYGAKRHQGKVIKAHRLVFDIFFGLPEDMKVLHVCDNRKCVNPFHLRKASQRDNLRDMAAKGRDTGKLSPSERQIIRELRGMYTQQELADHFGVSQAAISTTQRREPRKTLNKGNGRIL